MKKIILTPHCLFVLLLLCTLSCSTGDDGNRAPVINSLEAAISANCANAINYQDDQGDVYAYRADNIFGAVSIQAGGHSTPDQSTDLGVNIFGQDPIFGLPEPSSYAVNGGSIEPGTGYVFYIINNTEYISTDNNEGKEIKVERLELSSSGAVVEIAISFSNIEMVNTMDPDDLTCVSAFRLSFTTN